MGPTNQLLMYHFGEIGEKGWCFAALGSRNIVHVIIWVNHGVDSNNYEGSPERAKGAARGPHLHDRMLNKTHT